MILLINFVAKTYNIVNGFENQNKNSVLCIKELILFHLED